MGVEYKSNIFKENLRYRQTGTLIKEQGYNLKKVALIECFSQKMHQIATVKQGGGWYPCLNSARKKKRNGHILSMMLAGGNITNNVVNVSMIANRVIGRQSSVVRNIRAKEQVPKPSAIESEIYPSHKSKICSLYISPCGALEASLERRSMNGKAFIH